MSQEPDTASTEMAAKQPATDREHSRRALFAGAVGAGVGAVAATVLAGAQPAAAEGEAVTVGGSFTDATSTTSISTSSGTGLAGTTSDSSGPVSPGWTRVPAAESGSAGAPPMASG